MTKKEDKKKIQPDSFDYNLSAPIKYAEFGNTLQTDKVTLYSPSIKCLIKSMALAQLINIAAMKVSTVFEAMRKHVNPDNIKLLEEEKKEDETPQSMAEQARILILGSDVDFEFAMEKFKILAYAGCVLVNEKPINFIQWGQISEADQVGMFFQFVGVFILPSLFAAPKEEKGLKK